MAIKKLIEVWDGKKLVSDNINFLKQKTKPVHLPLSENNQNILDDLLDTFKAVPCAGVAANQIGYDKRIFIGLKHDDYDDGQDEEENKNISDKTGNPNADNYEFYINPQIDYCTKKSVQEGEEGCLSIPEVRIIAERFDKIKIRYYNQEGKKIKKKLTGFMSRLFQHELDHLDGVLMVENSKIKNVYRISENENLESLYIDLVKKLSD
tara:strand:+ start:41 stop:664 length:624 start_codon:yes stop_codon:yes gene_type:complete